MTRVEEENAELRRFLNDAVGSWTTEKQTTGMSFVLSHTSIRRREGTLLAGSFLFHKRTICDD